MHTETELGVVLEEGVRPRGSLTLVVLGVGAGGSAAAVDGGAAGGVGDDHPVAEQLGDELDIRGLAAACAGARELEQRLLELAVLDGRELGDGDVRGGLLEGGGVVPVGGVLLDGFRDGDHLERLLLGGADIDAVVAARAVVGADLHTELVALEPGRRLGDEGLGLVRELFGSGEGGTDRRVRADQRAAVALDALLGVPFGHADRYAALLELGGAGGHDAVGRERADGQLVAFLRGDGRDEVLVVVVIGHGQGIGAGSGGRPALGVVDFLEPGDGVVDAVAVHLDDRVALLAVGLLDGFLHVLLGVLVGDDIRELEECRLHDGVDALARAELGDDIETVQGVEPDVLPRDLILHRGGELPVHLIGGPYAVEQEGAALFEVGEHVVTQHIGRVVARHEVRLIDEVGAADGLVAEAQVGDGYAARLLGVVGEVALRVLVGVVADDLDAVLVGADGAVRTETVEFAGDGRGMRDIDLFLDGKRSAGHIVEDTHGEVVLLALVHVLVHGVDHGGVEFLAAEAVPAAEDFRLDLHLVESRDDIEVEGLAEGAGFLGAVEDGDLLRGLGERRGERFGGEGAVQPDPAAHDDYDAVGVLGAVVVDEVILPARESGDLVHHLLDDRGHREIVLIRGFAVLEVDVGVLSRARLMRMLGVERTGAETVDIREVDERLDLVVLDDIDLADFVRGPETVKEADEGDGGSQRGKMRHEAQVHDLLHGVGRQHGKARLTARHDIRVVAEYAERVRRESPRRNMEDAGEQLARDLVHVGDHEQQALAGGEGGGQRARGKRAVHRAGSARFGLHLGDLQHIAEDVLSALTRPFVAVFRHGRGGRDGVNRRDIRECVCDMRRSGITVDRHFLHRDLRISVVWFLKVVARVGVPARVCYLRLYSPARDKSINGGTK